MATTESVRKVNRRPPPLLRAATIHDSSPVTISSKSVTINVPGSNSPRVSWEESLNDLSRGLQLICGSPPSAGPMSPRRPTHPLSSPGPFAFGDPALAPVTSNPRKKSLRKHTGELRRADSVQVRGSRHPQRTIFVRHIETHAELQNRLVEICCTGTSPDGTQRTGSPRASTQAQARHFSLAKALDPNSFRIRVNVAPSSVEELVVRVGDRRRLAVETISDSGKILSESTLANETAVVNLVGQLEDDGVLIIRERPGNVADSVFSGTGSAFVPIVKHEETKLELTIVLHIPKEFRFEDLSVQTVDDHVIVTGKKRTMSLPQVVAFNFRSNGSVLPLFRVMLQLPPGTDSRSICAVLTRHHQLIIRGKLGPTSRRYTF